MFSRADPDVPAGERLDSPRWRLPLPRRAPLLRAVAVAALLCLAAAVLLLDDGRRPPRPAERPVTAVRPGPVLPPGTVGYPLRLPDAGVAAVLRPGQRVDVLASIAGRPADVLAADVPILRAVSGEGNVPDGTLLYLAVDRAQAARLAALVADARITVTVRSP